MSEEAAASQAVPAVVAPGRVAAEAAAAEGAAAGLPHAHLGRRNDRLLLLAVAAYAVLLSILMIARGISVTPDVVVVGFGLAALLLGRGKLFLRDWIPFLALFFAYELMRGYADKFGLPIHVTRRHLAGADRRAGRAADGVAAGPLPPAVPRAAPDGLATLSRHLLLPALPAAAGRRLPALDPPAPHLLRLRRRADRAVDGRVRDVPAAAGRAAVVGREVSAT